MDLEKLASESTATIKKWKEVPWFMYFCALSADLLMLSVGVSISWFSPVLPQLRSNDTNINPFSEPISTFQTSIITVISFSAIIMYTVWAKIIDLIGRINSIRIICGVFICGLTITAFATSINVYYVSLPITGVGVTGSVVAATVYNVEISKDSNRGTLSSIMAMHIPIGILIGYVFGSFTSVKAFTLLCTMPPIILLLCTFIIPETPYYLLRTKREFDASKSLERLRGTANPIESEIECKKIKEMIATRAVSKNRSTLDIFRDAGTRKALSISILLFLAEQMSGITSILSFVPLVFKKIDSGLSGETIGIIIGVVQLGTFIITTYLIDKIGRRKLILISTFFCGTSMLVLGLYFYLNHIGSHAIDNVGWLCILCVIIFVVSYVLGLGTVPLVFTGEIYPDDLRATGVALGLFMNQIILSTVTFCFPLIVDYYGPHYGYWLFSSFCLLACATFYFIMPETKGKTLLEIQLMFSKQ